MDRPVLYYAFVRRGDDRIFRASFVDFPDWEVTHEDVKQLPQAAMDAAIAYFARGRPFLAKPTPFADLPRMANDSNGYWMGFDLGIAAKTAGGSITW